METTVWSYGDARWDWNSRCNVCGAGVEFLVASFVSVRIGDWDWDRAVEGTYFAEIHALHSFTTQRGSNGRTRTGIASPYYQLHDLIGGSASF